MAYLGPHQQVDDVGGRHGSNPSEGWSSSDGHVSDDGGEQLGRVQVGDGEGHGDQELANHADGDREPDHL